MGFFKKAFKKVKLKGVIKAVGFVGSLIPVVGHYVDKIMPGVNKLMAHGKAFNQAMQEGNQEAANFHAEQAQDAHGEMVQHYQQNQDVHYQAVDHLNDHGHDFHEQIGDAVIEAHGALTHPTGKEGAIPPTSDLWQYAKDHAGAVGMLVLGGSLLLSKLAPKSFKRRYI